MNSAAICHNSSIRSIIITTFVNMYLKRASMFLMASIAQAVLSSSHKTEGTQKDITSTASLDSINAKLKTIPVSSGSLRAVNRESGAIGIAGHPIVSQMVQRKAIDVTNSSVVKLTASDGTADDHFGLSVAVSNGVVVVGAYGDNDKGSYSGSAYIFERNTTGTWVEVAKLTAYDGAVQDRFGASVSVSNDVVIVGAYLDDDNGSQSGSAYIYERDTTGTWVYVAKLTASDGAENDLFGHSVAVGNGVVVVGAPNDDDLSGSAYIYERSITGEWVDKAKLTAFDGATPDSFGWSVSVSNGMVVVGAHGDDDKGINSGSAYIYERSPTGEWVYKAKITAYDGAADDWFGWSVSVSDGVVVVGAPNDDDKGSYSGSAYIYEKNSSGTWVHKVKLTAYDGAADDGFGNSVSVSDGVVIVGAINDDDNGSSSGSAYIYERNTTGTWVHVTKLTAYDGAADDWFGWSVSVSDGVVVVGAMNDDDKGSSSGSAYIHELLAAPSKSPSSSPSASPSSSPSTSPSNASSSSPSTTPTASPSSSPSSSPSISPTVSNQPSSSSPSTSPHTSPTKSPSHGSGLKFYADWVTEDMICKNDGEAPQYMVTNPAVWLFDDIETCCTKFFGFNLNSCLGDSYLGSGKYYPDWLGTNEGCIEDVQASLAPSYMMQSGAFLYTTLDECCERHYQYRVDECKGLSRAGSNKWFVDWSTFKCVKDCDVADGGDCGGLADGFWDLISSYTTKEECCRMRISWDVDGCMA